MKHSMIALAVSAALVAACGQNSAGVAAGASADGTSRQELGLGKSKAVSADQAASAKVQMPAATLITEALFPRGNIAMAGSAKRALLSLPPRPAGELDMDRLGQRVLISMLHEAKAKPDWHTKKVEFPPDLVELVDAGASEEALLKATANDKFLGTLAACLGPAKGWEVNPMGGGKKLKLYIIGIAAACDFSDQVYGVLAERVGASALRDPDDARKKILTAWQEWASDDLERRWQETLGGHAADVYTTDLTGFAGIHFFGSAGDFANQGTGFTWTKAGGVEWFGGGHIGGKSVDLMLASSVSTKVEKTKSVSESLGTGASTKTGAEAAATYK